MENRDYQRYNETAKQYGSKSAQRLGERLLKQAEALEANGVKPPFNIMEIKTSRYDVQINYFGERGLGTIVVLDTSDPYDGNPNGQSVQYYGDAEATVMSIISQLEWIDSIHYKDAD